MFYLYHRVHSSMRGAVLYPLNELKHIYPDLYDDYVKKYVGREVLLERRIPILNCLWNDVLHLTAVSPDLIRNALRKTGFETEARFFKIDPTILDSSRTLVYLYAKNRERGDFYIDEDEWKKFRIEDLEDYSHISEDTLSYYEEAFKDGRKPLLFHRLPHILYRGTIDTKDLPIV